MGGSADRCPARLTKVFEDCRDWGSATPRRCPVGADRPCILCSRRRCPTTSSARARSPASPLAPVCPPYAEPRRDRDRKSTRLNSSHGYISYAVFCLKKKKKLKTHGCS